MNPAGEHRVPDEPLVVRLFLALAIVGVWAIVFSIAAWVAVALIAVAVIGS